jgi:hypothetical protein
MAFSEDLKTRLLTALAEPAAATELEAAVLAATGEISDTAYNATSWNDVTSIGASKNALRDKIVTMDATAAGKLTATQAANVAALAGTLTGTTTGTMVNVAAAAGACAGGATPTAAQVDTAIATAVLDLVTSTNLALKELQTKVNAEIAALKLTNIQASA